MASSQDLVTTSNWRGANLHELVMGQVARYSADPSRAIRFQGARPFLNPNAALHVGLALHRACRRSGKFRSALAAGRLRHPEFELADGRDGQTLSLSWSEEIERPAQGTPDGAVGEKRFGGVALERVVPASVNGTASLVIANGRLDYRLDIPRSQFELD